MLRSTTNTEVLFVVWTFLARMFLVSAMLMLNLAVTSARETVRIYRCTAKEGVAIGQDGTLDKLVGQIAQEHFDKVVIEIPDGHVTLPSKGIREEWIVEQTSAKENDFVLYPKSSRRIGHTAANAATNFIRLRATVNDPQPRFIAVTLSYIATGICEIVR
jgi:hypothetical protein